MGDTPGAFPVACVKMATHQGMDFMNAQILSKNGIVLDEQDLVSLKCNYCSKFLRDPHQLLGCGHRFCRECVSTCVNIGRYY